MNNFFTKYILEPLAGRWLKGFGLLFLWTISFIILPSISGWFLAICSVAFATSNILFAYLVPSAIIRLLALVRTATRYFERLVNHKSTLDSQQSLQLKIFRSVAKFPYFKKQVNSNSAILENSTYGVDQILNHILLWILPFGALLLSLLVYFVFVSFFSSVIAIEFLISSAVFLFIIPQFIFRRNKILYGVVKIQREENNQSLIETFRGRIEISKYNLENKAIEQYEARTFDIEQSEKKLQINSFWLQLMLGLGFSYIATILLYFSAGESLDAPTAIGIFFGIMAQAELAEMLFSGKSEKSSVRHQINDIESIFEEGEKSVEIVEVNSKLKVLSLNNFSAKVPETSVITDEISLEIERGEWIALYGETGKGKTTFLNGLFYPEYRKNGSLSWNSRQKLSHLPVPECIYVTQKAYLLTGTLRENFDGYSDGEIEQVLELVDLLSWRKNLPDGLDTWLGENSETLSGGQRKKLLLAQALLKKPQLLVIDEPSAGISSENAISIFENIKRTYPDTAILMATHLLDFQNVVDKVIKL